MDSEGKLKFFEDCGWKPRPDQLEVHNCTSRFRFVSEGVRAGKSKLASFESLWETFSPHSPEYPTWIVSSSYDNADAIFDIMLWTAKEKFANIVRRASSKYRILETIDGHVAKAKSSEEPGSLEAKGLHFLTVDECTEVKNIVWEERLSARILDTQAKVLALTSGCKKKGDYNWFYKVASRGTPHNDECAYFEYPSCVNPLVTKKEFERLRRSLPKHIFDERYMGKMISTDVELFANFEAVFSAVREQPKPDVQYIAGLDVGITHDLTVLSIFRADEARQVWMEVMPKGMDTGLQLNRIEHILKRYNNAICMPDATGVGSGGFVQELQKRELNIQPFFISTKAIRNKLIEDAIVRFDNMSWFLLKDDFLQKDYEDMTCDLMLSLTPTYKSVSKLSPDRMMSTLLANQLLERQATEPAEAWSDGDRVYEPEMKFEGSEVYRELGGIESCPL